MNKFTNTGKPIRLYGNYRALVREVVDEGSYQIKVEVLPFMKGIETKHLPIAEPCFSDEISMPPVGSTVWVFFEGGSIFRPVYFGNALPVKNLPSTPSEKYDYTEDDSADVFDPAKVYEKLKDYISTNSDNIIEPHAGPPELEMNDGVIYPYVKCMLQPSGIVLAYLNYPDDKQFWIQHPTGSYFNVDKDGNVHFHSEANTYLYVKEEVNIGALKDINATTDSNLNINVDKDCNVNINGNNNVTIGGNNTIKITENNDITIEGNNIIKIEGTSDVTVTKSVTIVAGENVDCKITGNAKIDIGGTANIKVGTSTTFDTPTGTYGTTASAGGGAVTQMCLCAFTGKPHPDASHTITIGR